MRKNVTPICWPKHITSYADTHNGITVDIRIFMYVCFSDLQHNQNGQTHGNSEKMLRVSIKYFAIFSGQTYHTRS